MVYPYREKPNEKPAEQNSNKPAEMEELHKEIAELKILLQDVVQSASERDIIKANLEEWADNIGEHITKEIVQPVIKQKGELEKIDVKLNALQDKADKLFRFSGFKEVLFWISVLCNIGGAGYIVYLLIKGSGLL